MADQYLSNFPQVAERGDAWDCNLVSDNSYTHQLFLTDGVLVDTGNLQQVEALDPQGRQHAAQQIAKTCSIPSQSECTSADITGLVEHPLPLTSMDTCQSKVERKRENDKAYRNRVKKSRMEIELLSQSQAKEIEQLKTAVSDLRQEIQKLQRDNDLLRQNAGKYAESESQTLPIMEENLSLRHENTRLMEEKMKLNHDNKILKVQIEALSEMIINNRSK